MSVSSSAFGPLVSTSLSTLHISYLCICLLAHALSSEPFRSKASSLVRMPTVQVK